MAGKAEMTVVYVPLLVLRESISTGIMSISSRGLKQIEVSLQRGSAC